jgi:hypothetical protein
VHTSLTRLALSLGLLTAALAVLNFGFGIGGARQASAAHDNFLTIEVVSPDGGIFAFEVDASPPCSDTSFALGNNDSRTTRCEEGEIDVTVDLPVGFTLAAAPVCDLLPLGEGLTPGLDSLIAVGSNGRVTIDITDNEHLVCTYSFEAAGGVITIIKDAPAANGEDFQFQISGTGSACDDGFILNDDESAQYVCEAPGTYTITETGLPAGWALAGITCSDQGIPSSDIDSSQSNKRVRVTLTDDGESLTCTFSNVPTATPTATATATVTPTATPGRPSGITITAPSSITCGNSASITVLVRDASGRIVADGTIVTIFASVGSVNPGVAGTSQGNVLAIYSAPANTSGQAILTVRANGTTATKAINITCAVPATATAVATSTPAPLTPPSTGSGGLEDGGRSLHLEVLAGLIVLVALLGGAGLMRRRAKG